MSSASAHPHAKKTTAMAVDCSDVFAWGCADDEDMNYRDIEAVYGFWKKDPIWGTAVWCMTKRKELPQRPVADRIKKAGIWALEDLTKEHGLRANVYDGMSGVSSVLRYAAYSAWAARSGGPVRPWDRHWWAGWKEFTVANPGWNSDEWKAAEKTALDAWKAENGWTTQ